MEETLVAGGVLRTLVHRKECVEFHSDEDRVQHLAFGIARVDVAALNLYCCSCRIEVLVFELSYCASVHCICILSSEFRNIKLNYTSSDFLVRSEADLDFAVFELRMIDDILDCIHDFCDAGLVVSSE